MNILSRFLCFLLVIGILQPAFAKHSSENGANLDSSIMNQDVIIKKNKQKFDVLKKYNLPIGKFAIGGSGPLGIRGIREINDIDILVSDDLRDDLEKNMA